MKTQMKAITKGVLAAFNKVVQFVKREGLPLDSNYVNTWRWEETANYWFFSKGYITYAYVSKSGPPFNAARTEDPRPGVQTIDVFMGGFASLEAAKNAVEQEVCKT